MKRSIGLRAQRPVLHRRLGGAARRAEGPVRRRLRRRHGQVIRPGRPLVDPGAEEADLLGGEPVPLGRHDQVGLGGRDADDQLALGALPRDDRRPLQPAAERRRPVVEPEVGLLLLRAVAGEAVRRQDRPDVPFEVDLPRGRGREREAFLLCLRGCRAMP